MSQTLVRPHEQAGGSVGLPVSWYFDPEILEIERQALFAAGPTYQDTVRSSSRTVITSPSAVGRPASCSYAAMASRTFSRTYAGIVRLNCSMVLVT